MAFVRTDATYYSPRATSIDYTASMTPYDSRNTGDIIVTLTNVSQNRILVRHVHKNMSGIEPLRRSIGIRSSDPRGTYRVNVYWHHYNQPIGSTLPVIITSARATVYLTN